jgi:hypothetical protein
MEHIERTPERQAIKEAWYEQQRANERQRTVIKQLPPEQLGPLEYIGGGAWLPGIPARNLKTHEVDRHYHALVENMAGPRPIYRLPQPAPEPQEQPAQDEQDGQDEQDQPQQQSEPAATGTSPRKRSQRRKEK